MVKDVSESNNGKDQSLQPTAGHSMHTYEIRPRIDDHGFDLISDALPSVRLWYGVLPVWFHGTVAQDLTRYGRLKLFVAW